jgi:WD40 repeat protein
MTDSRPHSDKSARRKYAPYVSLVAVLSLLWSACTLLPPPTPTATVDWTGIDPMEWVARAGLADVHQLHSALSPDGRWLARQIMVEPQMIQVFSTTDPDGLIEAPVDAQMGKYLRMGPWSPDGSAFVLYSAEEGFSHCPFSRLVVVHIDEQAGTLRYNVFNPNCNAPSPHTSASWSPDGKRLAVTLNRRQIYLINSQASLERTIEPTLDKHSKLFGLWWTSAGLFYHLSSIEPGYQHHELRAVDPDAPDRHRTLVESETTLQVVGWNPESDRLLVREQDTGYPPAETFDLSVLDPHSGAVEHRLTVEGSQCVTDGTPQTRFTALKVSTPEADCSLWFFDWEKNVLIPYGEIVALVGWRSNVQGFVVVKDALDNRLQLETIHP